MSDLDLIKRCEIQKKRFGVILSRSSDEMLRRLKDECDGENLSSVGGKTSATENVIDSLLKIEAIVEAKILSEKDVLEIKSITGSLLGKLKTHQKKVSPTS